jgi:2-dehydropantoate 2-reductase
MSSPSPRRYAIIGTGAIGGFYGGCLQRAGIDTHFLLHRDYDQVRQQGLRVDSITGDFVLPQVNAYDQVAAMPPVDVVIVALKTTQNALLPTLLPPLLASNPAVVLLQNGLDIESALAGLVPPERIFAGLCFICSNKIGPGHIRHLDYGEVVLGAYSPQGQPQGISPTLEQIAADFRQAQIPVQLTPDLLMTRWRKLVWNIPFNSLSVVLDATTDQMMANPHSRALAESLMTEVVTTANTLAQTLSPSQDRALPENLIATMLSQTAGMKPYRTSMKIDYDEGRPLEVEAILGNPLRAAQQAGIPTPQIQMLYQQVAFLNQQQSGR